jgi:hypothetical protein
MLSTPSTKEKVRGIDCDPKQASEAASNLFALNAGMKTFAGGCAGGDRLNEHKTTDALFGFARKCLADSGLPSKDTDTLRTKINFIDLSRDDKAHPFVVTINAFGDGNRLAYLALAIAIAMDSLIFMSGLFGANAVRSPLQDVPSSKARSASQLEGIIENALLPDTFENARTTLNAMRPITPYDGYIAEVTMGSDGSANPSVMSVLNAGATIGAVSRDPGNRDRYLVRAELFEFLSVVAKKAFEADKGKVRLAEIEKDVAVSLLPNVPENAAIVQNSMDPITEDRGFSAEVRLPADADVARVLRKFLNAGASHGVVQRAGKEGGHYFVHRDLVRTLSNIQARYMQSGSYQVQAQLAGPTPVRGALAGGSLNADRPRIVAGTAAPQLEAPRDSNRDQTPPLLAQPIVQPAAQTRQPPRAVATLDELRSEYYAEMLASIDLDASKFAHLTSQSVGELAKSAGERLSRLAKRHSDIKRMMDVREGDIEARLRGAYNRIWTSLADNPAKIQVLNSVQETIVFYLPALTLRNMLGELITALEKPAARDDGIYDLEQKLLDQLREIRGVLDGMDLGNEQAWQRLGWMMEQDGAQPVQVGGQIGGKRASLN